MTCVRHFRRENKILNSLIKVKKITMHTKFYCKRESTLTDVYLFLKIGLSLDYGCCKTK